MIGAESFVKQATTRMYQFVQKHCTVALPGREDFRRVAELARDHTMRLRTGDAPHLAIAESLNTQGILCLDQTMR